MCVHVIHSFDECALVKFWPWWDERSVNNLKVLDGLMCYTHGLEYGDEPLHSRRRCVAPEDNQHCEIRKFTRIDKQWLTVKPHLFVYIVKCANMLK